MSTDANNNPPDPDRASLAQRLSAGIEKNLVVVLGSVLVGAFLAGVGALLFMQQVVKAEIEDHWKGQMAALAKTSVEEQVKQRFGSREPALAKFFRNGQNECVRVNDIQYCWGREQTLPKWDAQAAANMVEQRFSFAAPFEHTPVVTMGIYPVRNQKVWAVFGSTRTASTLHVRAQDLSKGPQSEEFVLVSYMAVGAPGKD